MICNAFLIFIRKLGVTKPDNCSRPTVMNRMGKQMDEENKMQRCHLFIINDKQQILILQVLAVHENLLSIANKNLYSIRIGFLKITLIIEERSWLNNSPFGE
jgi:hypothetical protein